MKCKACGANYGMMERTCPYCGTPNALGHLWGERVTQHQEINREAREDAIRRTPATVFNWVIRTILALEIAVIVITLLGVILAFIFEDKYTEFRINRNYNKYVAELQTLVNEERWSDVYNYMEKYELYNVAGLDSFTDIAVMEGAYQEFNEYRMQTEDVKNSETTRSRDYYLEYTITRGAALLRCKAPNSSKERNIPAAQAKLYYEAAEDCLLYQIKLDPEDLDFLMAEDYISVEDRDALVQKSMERNGWEEYKDEE